MCRQPKKSGPCEALSEKWYFDQRAGTCLRFNYGGCGGNDNNFNTAEDCYYRCGGQLPGSRNKNGGTALSGKYFNKL